MTEKELIGCKFKKGDLVSFILWPQWYGFIVDGYKGNNTIYIVGWCIRLKDKSAPPKMPKYCDESSLIWRKDSSKLGLTHEEMESFILDDQRLGRTYTGSNRK